MNRITKFLSRGSFVALSALLLAACGDGGGGGTTDTGDASTPGGDSGEEITLTWSLWDRDATVYYQPLIDAFEAENDNIKIEMLDLGSTDYMTVLGTQLSGGDTSIDVVTIKDMPGYAALVDRNQLEPLNDLASDIDLDQYSGTVEQITVDDTFYGLPFRSDFYVIYYNKDIFDAAGMDYPQNGITFDEYDTLSREVSEKATDALGTKIYGGHYHTWRSQVQMYGLLDGENTLVSTDYSFLQPIYDTVLSLQADGIVQDYATLKTSSLHYSAAFYQNNVASMLMGTWFIPTLATAIENGDSEEFNWGMVTMPLTDGAEEGTSTGTVTTLGVSAGSKQKEAAWKFVEFVTSAEGSQIIAETGTMPAIQTADVIETIANSPGFPEDEASREALSVSKTYLELPLDEDAAQVETILNDAHDNIMTDNVDVAEELENASSQVEALKQ